MAMKVTKKADLVAKFKRDEAEKKAIRDAAKFLENDTLETVAEDLFWVAKRLVKSSLYYTEPDRGKYLNAYDGLEQMRVRLANQGIEVEWRDILVEEYREEYGMANG